MNVSELKSSPRGEGGAGAQGHAGPGDGVTGWGEEWAVSSAAAPGTVTMESLMESLTPSTEQGAGGSVLCNHSTK